MEEDIRLIENTIFNIEMTNSDYKYCDDNECWLSENQVKAIQNIIQGYKEQKCKADIQDVTIKNMKDFMDQLEKANKELKEAKKSMREKLHSEHRNRVYWERKAIQAKQVFEQKKTECKQLTKVLGEKNRKIKELEQANIRRAEDEFEALSWEE